MNQISYFFNIIISLSAINFIHGQSQETALLFNTETNAILNSIILNDSGVCVNCATACPFQSTSIPQMEFNRQRSITKNAFFLEEIYPLQLMKLIKLKICQKPFELSIIYDKIEKVLEFGYEIYYEDSLTNNRGLKESVYRKYGPLEELPTKPFERALSRIHQSFNKNLSFPNDKPNLPMEGIKMHFLWISAFKLSYNGVLRHPNRVTYETSVNVPDSPNKCSNYKLGEEVYKDIDMKKMYEQMLSGKKLHITSGTYETLQLNLKDFKSSVKPGVLKAQTRLLEIYLLNNKRIPIPAKIYKVIEYELPTCSENQENCWYSILIEIHNAPYFTSEDRICVGTDFNQCAQWGWSSVYENDEVQGRFISCCEVTTEIETKLKLKTDKTKSKFRFNLWKYKIGYYEGDEIERKTKSLKEMIDDVISGKPEVKIDDTPYENVAETGEGTEATSFDQHNQFEEATSTEEQPLLLK